MSTITRWNPVRDALRMQDEMNRLFGLTHRAFTADEPLASHWAPPVDIHEDAEGITLTAELPGLSPEDYELRVENNTLTLQGERKFDKEERRDEFRRVERAYGRFSRSFALPPTVDTEKVRAEAKNGVLTVFLPRREETRPRQIQVKVEA